MISIAGVLVAGSAAALVNTQVLGGSTAPSGLAVAAAPKTVQSAPTTTAATAASVPTNAVVATAPVVNSAPPAASTQAIYEIGAAGSVTLDIAGDVLKVVSVSPAPGWVLKRSENQDATNVEIKLQSGTTAAEFHANLLFGVVTTSVASDGASSTSVSVADNHRGGGGSGSDGSGGHGSDD